VSLIAFGTDADRGETRIVGPLAEWIRNRWTEATFFTIGFNVSDRLAIQSDLTVLTFGTYVLAKDVIDTCRAAGTRLVHDLADAHWLLPADHPRRAAAADAALRYAANRCSRVTVPTEALAAAARTFGITVPISVVPDAPDPSLWTARPRRERHVALRAGWVGLAGAHDEDHPLLEAVVAATPDIDWRFFGDVPAALEARARAERRLQAHVDPLLYPTVLAGLDLDVLVAPRADSARNRTKSDLLVRQAALLGYAVLTSERAAPHGLPVAGVADDPAAWVARLREFGARHERAHQAGDALAAAVDATAAYRNAARSAFTAWTGIEP